MKSIITLSLLLFTMVIYAQPLPPGGGTTPVPIDAGIIALLAAGGVYGVRQLKNKI